MKEAFKTLSSPIFPSCVVFISHCKLFCYAMQYENVIYFKQTQTKRQKNDFITIIVFFSFLLYIFFLPNIHIHVHIQCVWQFLFDIWKPVQQQQHHSHFHSSITSFRFEPFWHLSDKSKWGFWYFMLYQDKLNERSHHCLCFLGCGMPETYVRDKQ